jgi:hypothetical protein
MRCGWGLTPAECIAEHWCVPLRAELVGVHWRGRCPLCKRPGNFEISVSGEGIAWNCHTKPRCDHDQIRAELAELIVCRKGRDSRRRAALAREVGEILRKPLDPSEMRLRIGQAVWPEKSAAEVADELGLSRATRYRLRCPPRASHRETKPQVE